jgi:hypothetical protein
LDERNWIDWKDILTSTNKERGIWSVTVGTDTRPPTPSNQDPDRDRILVKITEWEDRDAAARNQMISNMTPTIRAKCRSADTAAGVWKKLIEEFESTDPERVAILRSKYENTTCGSRSITAYIDELIELRERLKRVNEDVSDTAFASRLLRGLPDSWDPAVRAIRMITADPNVVIQKLKAQEAADEAETASKPLPKNQSARALVARSPKGKPGTTCENCELTGHDKEECYDIGGGKARQWPKSWKYIKVKNPNYDPNYRSQRSNENHTKNATEANSTTLVNWMTTPDTPVALSANKPNSWALDSGCSRHITSNKGLLHEYQDIPPIAFRSAKREASFFAVGKGKATLVLHNKGESFTVILNDVLYAPECDANLISVSTLAGKGVHATFYETECHLVQNEKIIGRFPRGQEGLYWSPMASVLRAPSPELIMKSSVAPLKKASMELWHQRFAHAHYKLLEHVLKSGVVNGMAVSSLEQPDCEGCIIGKQSRAPFYTSEFQATYPLELVYCDIGGPLTPSLGGSIYFMVIFDAKSGFLSVFFLKRKTMNDTLGCLREWIPWAERQSGYSVKTITTDNGGEFVNSAWDEYCKEKGIVLRTSAPYTPQQNGKAERQNRILQEGEMALRHSANLPTYFWAEAMATTAYVRNRLPSSRDPTKTAYELFLGKKPSVAHLRTFGCKAYVLIQDEVRHKGEPRSMETKFIGYYENSRAWKLFHEPTRTFIKSRDVIFDEKGFVERLRSPNYTGLDDDVHIIPLESHQNDTGGGDIMHRELSPLTEILEMEETPIIPPAIRPSLNPNKAGDVLHPWNDPSSQEYGRGQRHRANMVEGDFEMCMSTFHSDDPDGYKEAMRSDKKELWVRAMEEEIKQLTGTGTWDLVELPAGRKAIGCRWVFMEKKDADGKSTRFKARLVAQGFRKCLGSISARVQRLLRGSGRYASC